MVRNLYRFYLYIVTIVLLFFVGGATGQLLARLLNYTPLRGTEVSVPSQAETLQAAVFFVVALVIGGVLGGLHYWLIRRDIEHDAEGATSAIRSFFLNITEGLIIAISVPFFAWSLLSHAITYGEGATAYRGGFLAETIAYVTPMLLIVLLLDLERRRTPFMHGTALTFQRIHYYGIQLILGLALFVYWLSVVPRIIDGAFFGGGLLRTDYSSVSYNVPELLIGVCWSVCFWLYYSYLTRDDRSKILRFILQGLSFAAGVGATLYAFHGVVKYVLTVIVRQVGVDDVRLPGTYEVLQEIVAPLSFGLLVIGVYHWCFWQAGKRGVIERRTVFLAEIAITAIIGGLLFWRGVGELINNTLRLSVPSVGIVLNVGWISSWAFVIVGVGYIALDVYLKRCNKVEPEYAAGPRRALVLMALAGGILALAIGGAVALYTGLTALIGIPLYLWQIACYGALSAFIVGVIISAIYLMMARQEQQFSHIGKIGQIGAGEAEMPVQEPVTVTEEQGPKVVSGGIVAETPLPGAGVAELVDALLAGDITRDEAIARLQRLGEVKPQASAENA